MATGMFDGYGLDGFYDEAFEADGDALSVRPHYRALIDRLLELPPQELARRERLRDAAFRSQGITFTVYGEEGDAAGGIERTFPMDMIPRIIPSEEWAVVEAGLVQRVTALNRFLEDLYDGERAVLHDRVVPRSLVLSASGFQRAAFGVPAPHGARCLIAGIDLVRDERGRYLVLEDNLRNPSGISYVLENRVAMTRVLPVAFARYRVRPVNHYPVMLHRALCHVAPPSAAADPTIVVLTPGVYNSAYFEHAFLARQMGIELVEGRDLVVDDHVVLMRTTRGLQRVDVIYRRIDDEFLDPVAFNPASMLGVPGLMGAARAGNVTVVNAVGNGVADDKAIYAYVPDLIRYYLDEDPILANVATYLLREPDQRRAALDRLDRLVVKPVAESGGYGLLIGPSASDEEIAVFRKKVEANPRGYIAQEVVGLSRHPTLCGDRPRTPDPGAGAPGLSPGPHPPAGAGAPALSLQGRHIDLRPFVITAEHPEVLPGGLTRVALRKDSLVVNSSQGGGSKDTWVLAAPGAPAQEDQEAAD